MIPVTVGRSHLVHTFISNVRGPAQRLKLGGLTIGALIPVTLTTGSVTASFAALSYAGTLTVTLTADRDLLPDLAELTGALGRELAGCSGRDLAP